MSNVQLSATQVSVLKTMKNAHSDVRAQVFGTILAQIRAQYGIPDAHKLRTGSDNHDSADYATIYRKKTGEVYPINATTGQWVGVTPVVAPDDYAWFDVTGSANVPQTVLDLYEGSFDIGDDLYVDDEDIAKIGAFDVTIQDSRVYLKLAKSKFAR